MGTSSAVRNQNQQQQNQPPQNVQSQNGDGASKIDQNLYSRQIYALGYKAMEHLRESKVLISATFTDHSYLQLIKINGITPVIF